MAYLSYLFKFLNKDNKSKLIFHFILLINLSEVLIIIFQKTIITLFIRQFCKNDEYKKIWIQHINLQVAFTNECYELIRLKNLSGLILQQYVQRLIYWDQLPQREKTGESVKNQLIIGQRINVKKLNCYKKAFSCLKKKVKINSIVQFSANDRNFGNLNLLIYNGEALQRMNRLKEDQEYSGLDYIESHENANQNDDKGRLGLHNLIAQELVNKHRFEEVLKQFDFAILKNPNNSSYYFHKANTLHRMNRFEEALEYFDLAIQQNPENPIYYHNKALTLDKMNRIQKALEYYDLAKDHNLQSCTSIIIQLKRLNLNGYENLCQYPNKLLYGRFILILSHIMHIIKVGY
ncbi:unnamed protein product [Paramecium octaurelia]|uniref:Tetratricopeptide repeat protein n=1 Tax=Paramecium octaurelia TaxID=43137 RepID=A0A8S1YRE2_PAROT|nr:unnamed protein product [Paramecium octaurelia]